MIHIPQITHIVQRITKMNSHFTHLDKCKVNELKTIAKSHNLRVSGTKPLLIQRIREHLFREKCASHIQKTFRGYIVRFLLHHMKHANKVKSLCVNECDCFTMEPISDIPFLRLYTVADSKDFIYGFDIISLLTMFKKCGALNPYTREDMSRHIVKTAHTLGRLIWLLAPQYLDKSELDVIDFSVYRPRGTNRNNPHNRIITEDAPVRLYRPQYNNREDRERREIRSIIFNSMNTQPLPQNTHLLIEICQEDFTNVELSLLNKIVNIRRLPIEQRIREVFIEIDLLGNYTHYTWFSELRPHEYYQFFSHLYNLWNYRAGLSREIKKQICILYDPFTNLNLPHDAFSNTERVREFCTTLIENIVYGSPDPEYRKLGCMHVLSALTLVSREARQNLYWLYESL